MDASTRPEAGRARAGEVRQVVLRRDADAAEMARAPAPRRKPDEALVRSLLVGLDGTDEEVVREGQGAFPPGEDRLVLGHECLGEVLEAPEESGLERGDRVVPLVRHGCGQCAPCRTGYADLCETGRYQEHGIQGLDGFLQDRWTDDPATLVRVPHGLGDAAVLAEPLSVVVKAVGVAEAMQARIPGFDGFEGRRVLLAGGTGSLGSLAALLLRDKGADVWAMDRTRDDAAGPRLLARAGVRHFNARERAAEDVARDVGGFDFILEATGSPKVSFQTLLLLRPNGVMGMLGVPPEKPPMPVEADEVMRNMVLRNQVLFGSVNSNRWHFEQAMEALLRFRERWGTLAEDLITHRFPMDEAAEAVTFDDEDVVKKVVEVAPS